ncbi:MAG: hypothetical protein NT103_07130 [Campylobacterales bacterium]|nr:hypothetical protein [Campylobacterales bacterium]
MMCERFSLSHICSTCQKTLLSPTLHKRKVLGSIPVYSFYPYDAIEALLLTKHTDVGYYIYTLLAKNSFSKFANEWSYENRVASIGIDDNSKSGYSHTAVLNRALKSTNITPYFGTINMQGKVWKRGSLIREILTLSLLKKTKLFWWMILSRQVQHSRKPPKRFIFREKKSFCV